MDSSATSQKPASVIGAVSDFYSSGNSNIHRGIYDLSANATDAFESARHKVAEFIGARNNNEIIFTSGTTEAINFVAHGWARKFLKKGDIVVTTIMEHHSNFVPWQKLQKEIGIELVILPIDKDYRLDYQVKDIDIARVKLLALTHGSNVLGTINPVAKIAGYFKTRGANAKLLVDAAQTIPHIPIDVGELEADFLAFSAHKMLGPTGVGVLYAKTELLEQMDPLIVGSHMIEMVTAEDSTWAPLPDKFEPGTRNIEGVIGLGAAIDYLQSIGHSDIVQHEQELTKYALDKLSQIDGLRLYGPPDTKDRLGVFSFTLDKIHPHDISEILNRTQVAVRSGHHCAQPLLQAMGVPGTIRASIYLYNTPADIDKLISGIQAAKRVFHV